MEAEADLERVLVIDDRDMPLTLADERIARAIRENNARLVIIDPVQAFLGADVDMNACTGSMITSLALFSLIALAMRSSARVSGVSLSSMTSTRSRSASASISRGLTVSPRPSSAV